MTSDFVELRPAEQASVVQVLLVVVRVVGAGAGRDPDREHVLGQRSVAVRGKRYAQGEALAANVLRACVLFGSSGMRPYAPALLTSLALSSSSPLPRATPSPFGS